VRRLLRLQGTMKPAQIVSALSYPGSDNTLTLPGYHGMIHMAFASPRAAGGRGARAASVSGSPLTPSQWLQLIAQIGEIPEPSVSSKASAAAIPDPGTASAGVGSSSGGSAQTGSGPSGSAQPAPSSGGSAQPSAGSSPNGTGGE
jgi:hypothetical protein